MRNFLKTALLFIMLSLAITSCGKRGALYYEGERKQPNFEKISDELN